MDSNDNTTLEVVRDDQGSAAWRECGPGGCTISRQRLDEKARNAARTTLEVLVTDANGAASDVLQKLAEAAAVAFRVPANLMVAAGFVTTATHWMLPTPWESKRRKRRARGRQIEAKRLTLGQPWEASDDD
jgi:hypothetical protein